MENSLFKQRVIEIVEMIPKGKVVSYGQVALLAGIPRAAQAVGQILHNLENVEKIPWQRIINSRGRISTTCLEHTADLQRNILLDEGIEVGKELDIDMEKYRWIPDAKTIKKLELPPEALERLVFLS